MAAPAFVQAGTGQIWTTGAAVTASLSSAVAGNFVILHILADDTGSTVTIGTVTNITAWDGTASSIKIISDFQNHDVGSPTAAAQILFMGRVAANGTASVAVSGSGPDLYFRLYEFSGVHTGTSSPANFAENGAVSFDPTVSTSSINGTGTSTTVSDRGVTTNGTDRLALNFVGINDDATGIAAFAGMSGGTWAMPTSFESATGTDGTISLMTATIASAGTIDGGSDTITSDGWGVIGFALIPASTAPPASLLWQPAPRLVARI